MGKIFEEMGVIVTGYPVDADRQQKVDCLGIIGCNRRVIIGTTQASELGSNYLESTHEYETGSQCMARASHRDNFNGYFRLHVFSTDQSYVINGINPLEESFSLR